MSPDERAFLAHLEMGPFQSGVDRGRWRLISIDWPLAIIAVSAAPRPDGPAEYAFRFECSDYPRSAPSAQPWDPERNAPLPAQRWPTGRGRVPAAFRTDWHEGQYLYLPCDRLSIVGHESWRNDHPSMIWSPSGDITQYLGIIHELLNSSDYTGPRST